MNEEIIICPDCGTEIKRKYGISALVYECPKCGKEWIKCIGKLMSRDEFHQRVADEK